jgi:L-malate glycosyltransferase
MLTVLIATYNGAKTLPEVLGAYCHLQVPRGGWKLVIVDNGSTDATKEVIHSFMDRLPLSYVFEPSRGKNVALNTGLASIEGDLVVLSDDDTLPRCDWLKELRLAADSHPSFSMFGGRVILRWEVQPEQWILSWVKLGVVFALTDPSWEEGPINPASVFGGNMAIRARIFKAGYRFDSRRGPRGHWYAMGSETELTRRLGRAGFNSWHSKRAIVEHMVRKSQMTRRWIFSRALKFGRGVCRNEYQHKYANRKKFLGLPRGLLNETVKKGLGIAQATLYGDRTKVFERRWALNYVLGQLIEAWLIHKELQSDGTRQAARSSERLASSITNIWSAPKGLDR